MKEIKLAGLGGGHVALVDDEDFERVSRFKWKAKRPRNVIYAVRRVTAGWVNGKQKQREVRMHRFILDFPDYEVDHRNLNGLDNQKHNLRPATASQNRMNSPRRIPPASGYRGVRRLSGKYAAQICVNYQQHHIGLFETPVEAAVAYDAAAIKLYGVFATLNFP